MQFSFTAIIETIDIGGGSSAVICLPKSLVPELPFYNAPRLKVDGEINGFAFESLCQASQKGSIVLTLGRNFLQEVNLKVGDEVVVHFDIVDNIGRRPLHPTTSRGVAEIISPNQMPISIKNSSSQERP